MTDNDIKKAFNDALILDSMNIELWHDKEDKPILLPLKEVAELINHLQESKEYYKKSRDKCQDNVMYLSKECDEWQEKCDRLQAENERLKKANESFANMGKLYSEIKAEAYKEFAEKAVEQVEKARQKYQRLCKEQGEEMEEYMHIHFNGITKIINNLLKETVGEDK